MTSASRASGGVALLITTLPLACLPRVEATAETGTTEIGDPPSGGAGADARAAAPADLGRLSAWADAECQSCISASCTLEARACGDVPECRNYYDCLGQCAPSDLECRSRCLLYAQALTPQETSLRRCLVDHCSPACTDEFTYFDRRGGACGVCVEQRCGHEAETCHADDACVAQLDCEQKQLADRAFDVEDFLQECAQGGPYTAETYQQLLESGGGPPGVVLDECTYHRCRQSCFGRDWKCLGAYNWKPSEGATANIVVRTVIDGIGVGSNRGAAAPDALVTPCGADGCDETLAQAADATTGRVTFRGLQTQNRGFEGFFRVDGPTTGARFWPGDVHFSYPLAEGEHTAFLLGSDVLTLAESRGHVQEPDKGIVLATVEDCHPAGAIDVEVTLSPSDGTTRLYMNGAYPGDGDRTTTGSVLFLNVDPDHTVSLFAVYDQPDQNVSARPLEVSQVEGVEVAAGRVTSVTMTPTPR